MPVALEGTVVCPAAATAVLLLILHEAIY